ncbi:hypothetical protein [Desulforamulus ferrireducens]|uniref:hypothetical protein n=1 Tax=Desulforamulus ferrireducens TaxID=1833852 RepID=UPI001473FD91|nr:hypothetical protein [Desulforamulus ferrireducens]
MITDINSYRNKQKLEHINELVKELMAIRAEIGRLKLEECQLKAHIKELTKELGWPDI